MIKRYYSMSNCNQKGIKYYYGFKDNNKQIISQCQICCLCIYMPTLNKIYLLTYLIAISFGFQNFSENSLSACVKQNKL